MFTFLVMEWSLVLEQMDAARATLDVEWTPFCILLSAVRGGLVCFVRVCVFHDGEHFHIIERAGACTFLAAIGADIAVRVVLEEDNQLALACIAGKSHENVSLSR